MPPTLSPYRHDEVEYFNKRVELNQTTLVTSLPGLGCSYLFKYLKGILQSPQVKTVLVDLNMLHNYTVDDFFDYLFECIKNETKFSDVSKNTNDCGYKDIMEYFLDVSTDKQQVVFIIDRFEKACQLFPLDIFDAIRAVTRSSNRKITFILGIDRELTDLRTIEELDQFYTLINLFTYYLKPLEKNDTIDYINKTATEYRLSLTQKETIEIYKLTGGHLRMIKTFLVLLLNNDKKTLLNDQVKEISKDPSITYQCERVFKHLNSSMQDTLLRIVNKIKLTPSDDANINKLLKMGIIEENNDIFSPLFATYLLSISDYKNKSLYLDEKTGEIYKGGSRIDNDLSANEYKLLKYLYENAYQIVNRDELAQGVWGASTEAGVSDEAIDQLISRLREKIEDDRSNPKHIFTHRGRGFQFKP